jgi:hypothetical protein
MGAAAVAEFEQGGNGDAEDNKHSIAGAHHRIDTGDERRRVGGGCSVRLSGDQSDCGRPVDDHSRGSDRLVAY